MPNQPEDYLNRHFQASSLDLSDKIDELLALAVPTSSKNWKLYREMLNTVIQMAAADRNRWDAKIMLQTLKELETSFSLLERFKRRRKVTVFGSARTSPDHPLYTLARNLGKILAQHNLMVITGAGGGIMAAAHEGAGLEHSLGFNIALPFEQGANETVHGSRNLLSFHFFFLRKLFFVKEADALVLCPGGFGTLDEALEVLTLIQTGKSPLVPIILLDDPQGTYWEKALAFMQDELADNHYILPNDLKLMRLVHSPKAAGVEIARFYRNYHSSRWQNKHFVIRLQHGLSDQALNDINQTFKDLCVTGNFSQHTYCAEKHNDPEFCNLIRLEFVFNQRDFGRLRELVDFINLSHNWA